jgi:biopolymer transport protein ExbD
MSSSSSASLSSAWKSSFLDVVFLLVAVLVLEPRGAEETTPQPTLQELPIDLPELAGGALAEIATSGERLELELTRDALHHEGESLALEALPTLVRIAVQHGTREAAIRASRDLPLARYAELLAAIHAGGIRRVALLVLAHPNHGDSPR